MTTFVIRDGTLVDKRFAAPLHSGDDAPRIIRDGMDPTLHMADGNIYDSKRAFRRATKDAGCVEVGDQAGYGLGRKPIVLPKAERVENIKRAIHELRHGR